MQLRRIAHLQRWIVGSLVAIWLLLGGLALAEQLTVVPETNSSDEEALGQFQLAVKSDTLDASSAPPLPALPTLSIIVVFSTVMAPGFFKPVNPFDNLAHTRSLPCFTCCYRL